MLARKLTIFSSEHILKQNETDVNCISCPGDIDDTVFITHPVVPSGLTLGDLKGTPDYAMGLGMISALREAADKCEEFEQFNFAEYPWFAADDMSDVRFYIFY